MGRFAALALIVAAMTPGTAAAQTAITEGGGPLVGAWSTWNAGIPPLSYTGPCWLINWHVSATGAQASANTAAPSANANAYTLSVDGSGCTTSTLEDESVTGSFQGNLAGSVSCPSMSGGYDRRALVANLWLAGNCTMNGVSIGLQELTAVWTLVPIGEGGNGAINPTTNGEVAGTLTFAVCLRLAPCVGTA